MNSPDTSVRLKWEMFALSFTALFLEMMVIRWVPSVVHLVAYYANLMLLSSFLGLGAGAMASGKRWNLLGWFPLFLAVDIGMLIVDRNAVIGNTASEAHFFELPTSMFNATVLVRIFAMNALLFVPLGQRMGVLFNSVPRLTAYAWDLAGSLAGTLCFGLFSLKLFSPALGMALVMAVYLILSSGKRWWLTIPLFAAVILGVTRSGERNAIWSPYYYITVSKYQTPTVFESEPPADLLTMKDPPVYLAKVNQFGYHIDGTLDANRYTEGTATHSDMHWLQLQYQLPYNVATKHDRVLVVGAGGGADVEAALSEGAKHVDAVEIDRTIIGVSRKFNAGAPYSDPRVTVHIDDARSYLAKAKPGYDMVIFGFLDSQALFSSMNNVRLDGYVYTVESIRTAYRLLGDQGTLALSFYLGKPWLGVKLYHLVKEATGREPTMYFDNTVKRTLILCVPKDPKAHPPVSFGHFQQGAYSPVDHVDLPTDDWPFLYLITRTIPKDYVIAIASLLAFSVATIAFLRRSAFGKGDIHFGLLGMGFLLLETKSISDCSLFFGTTWFVTLIVVAGVLLMVISANLIAERMKGVSLWMFLPLFAALALLLLVPRESILQFEFPGRLLWTILAVPLPILFAGIIFSTTFRDTASPSAAFGANLIGAMVGGFCEYLVMAVGNHQLSLLVVVAYLGSFYVLSTVRRSGGTI
ncbi:MAG TPA: hypothetical protein VFE25_12410 [Opitutaceae bacterium]|nr:hypothetical protein [Opitutaceae bacterium]